ncbi:DUF3566 domain-containing protein [Streptomyces sp. NPDC040750]|uniref:DUF3566 domain-containing protein n=1 Tax=Streptomyces sp. NPDC040750 TaxID=3154491 RepID=UPI00340DA329
MVSSFLLLTGIGVLAAVSTAVVWIMLEIMAPDSLPPLTTVLAIAAGVVALEVVLGTFMATLVTFIYNVSAQYNGGVEVALTDDLTDPTPAAAQALLRIARTRVRARRYLRAHTPPWVGDSLRRLPALPGTRTRATRPAPRGRTPDKPPRTPDSLDPPREVSDTA